MKSLPPALVLLAVLTVSAAPAIAIETSAASDAPGVARLDRPMSPETSAWARWTRGAAARRDDLVQAGSALLQRFRWPTVGAIAMTTDDAATDPPARSAPPRPVPAPVGSTEGPSTGTASPTGDPRRPPLPSDLPSTTVDPTPARPGAWRLGVERTPDDPATPTARPTRLRVTVAREWAL